MKTLEEISKANNYKTRLLFHSKYWDGPIDGLMMWEGKKKWFSKTHEVRVKIWLNQAEIDEYKAFCQEENVVFRKEDCYDLDIYNCYEVYCLPKLTLLRVIINHAIFSLCVGTHCNYTLNKKGRVAEIGNNGKIIKRNDLKPYILHPIWYKVLHKLFSVKVDVSTCKSIGEFKI